MINFTVFFQGVFNNLWDGYTYLLSCLKNKVFVVPFIMPFSLFALEKKESIPCELNVNNGVEYSTCYLNYHNTPSVIDIQTLLEEANKTVLDKQITVNTLSYWQVRGAKGGNGFNLGKDKGLGGRGGYSELILSLAEMSARYKINDIDYINILWGKQGRTAESENHIGKSGGTGASSTLLWLNRSDKKVKAPTLNNLLLIAGGGGGGSATEDGGNGGAIFQHFLSFEHNQACRNQDLLDILLPSDLGDGVYALGSIGEQITDVNLLEDEANVLEIGGHGGSSGYAKKVNWHNAEYYDFTEEYKLDFGILYKGIRGGRGGGFGVKAHSHIMDGLGGGSFAIKGVRIQDEVANIISKLSAKYCSIDKGGPEVAISFFPDYN